MKTRCSETKDILTRRDKGLPVSPREKAALRKHIASCSDCRDRVLDPGLAALLSTAFSTPVPEPSPSFYAGLSRKIEGLDSSKKYDLFSELFLPVSLKLVPVMAALLLMLSATFALYYDGSLKNNSRVSVEERVLFNDGEINAKAFLQEILIVEVQNGK